MCCHLPLTFPLTSSIALFQIYWNQFCAWAFQKHHKKLYKKQATVIAVVHLLMDLNLWQRNWEVSLGEELSAQHLGAPEGAGGTGNIPAFCTLPTGTESEGTLVWLSQIARQVWSYLAEDNKWTEEAYIQVGIQSLPSKSSLKKPKISASCSTSVTETLSMEEIIRTHWNRSNHPSAEQERNKKQTENPCCRINWIGCKWLFFVCIKHSEFFCDLSVLRVAVECYPKVD